MDEQTQALLVTIGTSSLVAALITLGVNFASVRREQRAKARALLRGIMLELERAEECATTYTKETEQRKTWSPNYRAELEYMRIALPVLSELRAIKHHEAREIHRLYIYAGEVNRSLDSLAALIERNDESAMSRAKAETSRCRGKCKHVIEQLPFAKQSVTTALKRLIWFGSIE